MTEFGETLRQAREAKGLTIAQISEATNMLPQQIEDLENENFTRIAAPIYGRGFVKLYCGAVGLDPQPLVAEFMDIYNGNKQPTIKFKKSVRNAEPVARQPRQQTQEAQAEQRQDDDIPAIRKAAVPPPAEPPREASKPEPEPVQESMPEPVRMEPQGEPEGQPPVVEEPSLPVYEEPAIIRAAATPMPAEVPQPAAAAPQTAKQAVEEQPFRLEQETVSVPTPSRTLSSSRYCTPPPTLKPDSRYSDFYIPPIVWRGAVVVAGICLIGWLLFALGSKVWRAATSAPEDVPVEETLPGDPNSAEKPNESALSTTSEPSKPRPERTPIKLPPIYND